MSNSASKHDTAGRVYGGEKLADRTARRRLQFLDAGLQIFGTTGYRTATVRKLCKQAELTDRYFYESFENLEDLLIAVYRQQFDQLQHTVMTHLMATTQEGDAMATIRAGLNALFDMAAQPCVARVCWLEVLGVSPKVDATYISNIDGFADMVIGFARHRYPQWQVDDDEARMLGLALVGAVSQAVTHWVLGQYKEPKETLLAATSRVFEGVWTSLANERAR